MNNILQKITSFITIEVTSNDLFRINGEGWFVISSFLFFLLGVLVITTSLKSKRIKKYEKEMVELIEIIEDLEKNKK